MSSLRQDINNFECVLVDIKDLVPHVILALIRNARYISNYIRLCQEKFNGLWRDTNIKRQQGERKYNTSKCKKRKRNQLELKQPLLFLFLHQEILSFLSSHYLVPRHNPFTFPFHKVTQFILHSSSKQDLHVKLDILCPPAHIRNC